MRSASSSRLVVAAQRPPLRRATTSCEVREQFTASFGVEKPACDCQEQMETLQKKLTEKKELYYEGLEQLNNLLNILDAKNKELAQLREAQYELQLQQARHQQQQQQNTIAWEWTYKLVNSLAHYLALAVIMMSLFDAFSSSNASRERWQAFMEHEEKQQQKNAS